MILMGTSEIMRRNTYAHVLAPVDELPVRARGNSYKSVKKKEGK